MLNIYIIIDRFDNFYNYVVDERLTDFNGEPFTVEKHVENIFLIERYVEQVKVYQFDGKMKYKKTYNRK